MLTFGTDKVFANLLRAGDDRKGRREIIMIVMSVKGGGYGRIYDVIGEGTGNDHARRFPLASPGGFAGLFVDSSYSSGIRLGSLQRLYRRSTRIQSWYLQDTVQHLIESYNRNDRHGIRRGRGDRQEHEFGGFTTSPTRSELCLV